MVIILGLDPGSQVTGYGCLQVERGGWRALDHGVIKLPERASLPERLQVLSEELAEVFARCRPEITVVERVFLGKNPDSAFKLGHARGVCLAMAARSQTKVVEYATRSVKKAVTGQGSADKEQVALVLSRLLGIEKFIRSDASDAMALAVCHARELEVQRVLRQEVQS